LLANVEWNSRWYTRIIIMYLVRPPRGGRLHRGPGSRLACMPTDPLGSLAPCKSSFKLYSQEEALALGSNDDSWVQFAGNAAPGSHLRKIRQGKRPGYSFGNSPDGDQVNVLLL
jgi:hypothetical protein